jgi:hypothetical protein
MAHDVFISHSSLDRTFATAACSRLEQAGIRCWIAPRDVPPGSDWATSIVKAIQDCRIMVLIFTGNANAPGPVWKEIERASHHLKVILPFRIENVSPKDALEFHLSSVHWLDAITPPLEQHFDALIQEVRRLLGSASGTPQQGPRTLPSVQTDRALEEFPLGETRTGTISTKGGKEFFGLLVESGDVIFAQLTDCGVVAMRPLTWNPTIEIRDPKGAMVLAQSEAIRCWVRSAQLMLSGEYSIAFGDSGRYESTGGSFSAFAQRVNRPARAKTIRRGDSLRGFINRCGEVNTYVFEVKAGDRIALQVAQHTQQGIGPHVEVYDPRGDLFEVAEKYDITGVGMADPVLIETGIEGSGLYTVLVSAYGRGRTGGYRISLNL